MTYLRMVNNLEKKAKEKETSMTWFKNVSIFNHAKIKHNYCLCCDNH